MYVKWKGSCRGLFRPFLNPHLKHKDIRVIQNVAGLMHSLSRNFSMWER